MARSKKVEGDFWAMRLRITNFTVSWAHFVGGTSISILLGFYPQYELGRFFSNRLLNTLNPIIVAIAAICGVASVMMFHSQRATETWTAGLVWISLGFFALLAEWNPAWDNSLRLEYALGNLLGFDCGSSECLGTLIWTTPFLCSIAYSVGAFAAKLTETDASSK